MSIRRGILPVALMAGSLIPACGSGKTPASAALAAMRSEVDAQSQSSDTSEMNTLKYLAEQAGNIICGTAETARKDIFPAFVATQSNENRQSVGFILRSVHTLLSLPYDPQVLDSFEIISPVRTKVLSVLKDSENPEAKRITMLRTVDGLLDALQGQEKEAGTYDYNITLSMMKKGIAKASATVPAAEREAARARYIVAEIEAAVCAASPNIHHMDAAMTLAALEPEKIRTTVNDALADYMAILEHYGHDTVEKLSAAGFGRTAAALPDIEETTGTPAGKTADYMRGDVMGVRWRIGHPSLRGVGAVR